MTKVKIGEILNIIKEESEDKKKFLDHVISKEYETLDGEKVKFSSAQIIGINMGDYFKYGLRLSTENDHYNFFSDNKGHVIKITTVYNPVTEKKENYCNTENNKSIREAIKHLDSNPNRYMPVGQYHIPKEKNPMHFYTSINKFMSLNCFGGTINLTTKQKKVTYNVVTNEMQINKKNINNNMYFLSVLGLLSQIRVEEEALSEVLKNRIQNRNLYKNEEFTNYKQKSKQKKLK